MYSKDVKQALQRLIKKLGGKLTIKMTHTNTHLFVPVAGGEKYIAATSFGIRPVTADWLVMCAAAGQLFLFMYEGHRWKAYDYLV